MATGAEAHRGRTRTESSTIVKKNLYEILGIEKTATDDDIKRAYRKLALRYHPDKNLDGDAEKTEKFKEINYAHSILSNAQKRKIYDVYGEMGLKMMEQVGENTMLFALKPWFKWVFGLAAVLTCGCFGCCCCCLFCCNCFCNGCCGRCQMTPNDDFYYMDAEQGNAETITVQPGAETNGTTTSSPIVLGPPPPQTSYGSTSSQV
uniref:J domain-containing protein n=1 Tax=Panagrolaimus sp. JU765 TaxID=591449 RepID=A0AC34R101_9BILA